MLCLLDNLDPSFCNGTEDAALTPFMARIARDMGPFILQTSEDTLSLVLETLSVIVSVDQGKWLTADLANALVHAILDVWVKNNKGLLCGSEIFRLELTFLFRPDSVVHLPGYPGGVVLRVGRGHL